MRFGKIGTIAIVLAALLGLAGCAATSSSALTGSEAQNEAEAEAASETVIDLKSRYARLQQTGGKLFALDPKTSSIRIYVFSSGAAPNVGHAHVLSAPQFTGYLYLPTDGARHAQFDLEFQLKQLEIDNPQYRATLGNAFAAAMTPEDIAGTREHMLGENNLQAERFPLVRIRSLQITGDAPKFAAKIRIEMHGQSRDMWVPLNVEGLPEHLAVTGSFVLRQSDFGIKPYSILGGLLATGDELVVEFQLNGA